MTVMAFTQNLRKYSKSGLTLSKMNAVVEKYFLLKKGRTRAG